MSAPRPIGQDNEVSVLIDNQVVSRTMAIVSFELTYEFEIKMQGMLGERTQRVDEVFKNVSGSIEFQLNEPEVFEIYRVMVDRAQRRALPYPRISGKSKYMFPALGRGYLIIVPDMKFGSIPIKSGGREEWITSTFTWSCETAPIVPV